MKQGTVPTFLNPERLTISRLRQMVDFDNDRTGQKRIVGWIPFPEVADSRSWTEYENRAEVDHPLRLAKRAAFSGVGLYRKSRAMPIRCYISPVSCFKK